MVANNSVQSVVDKATRSDAFEFGARAGYAFSGALHLLVAYIILHIAFGSGGTADQSGALGTVAGKPFGAALLWIAAIGLLALALWRLAETIVGPHPSEGFDAEQGKAKVTRRAKSFSLAVVYVVIAFSVIKYAMGTGEPHAARNSELSARLMASTAGKLALIAVGAAILAVGGYHIYKGFTKRFLKDLKRFGGQWIAHVGVAGYIAKGAVLAGTGILVIVATLTADPAKASGLDATVKTFGAAPFGKVLLILAALGVAAFGVYSFVRSRYGRM